MALRESRLAVKFQGGIDTATDDKAVAATELTALENGQFNKGLTIGKRNGYDGLSRAIEDRPYQVEGGRRLGVREDELLEFTADRCYSHQPSADQWSDAGPAVSARASNFPAVRTGTEQTQPDHATNNGVTVYAWEDSLGGVWWSTVDELTKRTLRPSTQADALGQRPRCVAVGNVLHVYYAVPSTNRIMIIVVNPSTPSALVAPTVLTEDLDTTTPAYDACPTTRTNTPAVIAWVTVGLASLRVGFVDASGVLGSPTTGYPSVISTAAPDLSSPLAVAFIHTPLPEEPELGTIVTAAIESDEGVVREFSADGSIGLESVNVHVVDADVVIRIALCFGRDVVTNDEGQLETQIRCYSIWEDPNTGEPTERFCRVVRQDHPMNASTPVVLDTIRGVGLASRAFAIDGMDSAMAYFVHDATFFGVYLCLRLSDATPMDRALPGISGGAPTRGHLPSVHVTGSVASLVLPYRERVISEDGDQFTETGIRRLTLDYDDDDSHQSQQIGRGLYMAAGCPLHYDGSTWTEQGFHVGPEHFVVTPAAGGSMTASSTYSYRAYYEWTDAQGEVHRGPTSVNVQAVLAGGETQVTLDVPTLRVTGKTNVRIVVARSRAGDTAEFFRVTSADATTVGDPNGHVPNDKTLDSVQFLDRMSDVDLALQEPLYTNGGILSNDPAPLGFGVTGAKSRLFWLDANDPNKVRFSQQIDEGFGLEIAPELIVLFDQRGGALTALAAMDDAVYGFKRDAILGFIGDGPDATGAGGGFTQPELITTDVGCVDPASIALAPVGLFFKSAKGIYLLGRDRSVAYVGAKVEGFNAQTIRRSTVSPDRSQVIFLTDDGTSLLYNYQYGQWSTFTNHTGLDAAVVRNAYHYLRTDQRVFRETVGQFSDDGVPIRLRFETAWIHLTEHLQGWQRFWQLHLLGTWISPHQLGVSYRTDFVGDFTSPFWFDATGDTVATGWLSGTNVATVGVDPITGSAYGDGAYGAGPYGGTSAGPYEWRFGVHENGQAIQFRFEEFEKVGLNGGSFELTEMALLGGVAANTVRPFGTSRSS